MARWRHKLGRGGVIIHAGRTPSRSCSWVRRAASWRRGKAIELRHAYEAWRYQWAWWEWMPGKWQRIGRCETGGHGGTGPGGSVFTWNSGTYQGFVGFYYGTWDAYAPEGFPSEAYNATPRQQMIVAEIVRAHHGYGAWGCGGA